MISAEARQLVRERAGFACEYCGVTEISTGAELTIDHHRPKSKGGTDEVENLVYCCHRCNQYKSAYWSSETVFPPLWNPRTDPAEQHFLHLNNGRLAPVTETGQQTILTLRLNRPLLMAHRVRKRRAERAAVLLRRNLEIVEHLIRVQKQKALSVEEQLYWAKKQRTILQELLVLEGKNPDD